MCGSPSRGYRLGGAFLDFKIDSVRSIVAEEFFLASPIAALAPLRTYIGGQFLSRDTNES
jgi:hypothetical protein